jgi:hypothetical protein
MKTISAAFALVVALFSFGAQAQTTQIGTDYLMTIHIPTERKSIDGNLVVVNILPGGWVNRLKGIAKMAKYKRTKEEAYVEYDVFAAR